METIRLAFQLAQIFLSFSKQRGEPLEGSSIETHGGFLPAVPRSAKELFAWGAEETRTIARCLKDPG